MGEAESESYKELMEESERIDAGLTNEVGETPRGTILKKYESFSFTSLFDMIVSIPSGRFGYPDARARIENEMEFREYYSGEVILPEVLGREGNYVEFEKIEGEGLNVYLNEHPEDAEELGRKVGRFTKKLHGDGVALVDYRLDNFIVLDNLELASIDMEFATEDASRWDQELDLTAMLSSVRQVNPESYREFVKGFREVKGDVGIFSKTVTISTSLVHSVVERDFNRFSNAVKNILHAIA